MNGQEIYERYAKARDAKNLRNADVSRMTGVRSTALSEWKRGLYTPKYQKLKAIADALEVDVSSFFTDEPETDEPETDEPETHHVGEDKRLITQKLFDLLKITRAGSDLTCCEYSYDQQFNEEFILLRWRDKKTKCICVTADSGTALIADVLKAVR